jgi:hypothetical protein
VTPIGVDHLHIPDERTTVRRHRYPEVSCRPSTVPIAEPWTSSKGCGLEVEHARACYPHDPPASFTGTGRALYDTPTSTSRPLSPPN